jgi:DNA-binding NarL/FixJ family response regulator
MPDLSASKEKKKLIDALGSLISYAESKGISRGEILGNISSEEKKIPLSVSKMLMRSGKTTWASYERAKAQMPERISEESEFFIPAEEFSNRKFSVLENAVAYLRMQGLSTKKIAAALKKNYQTIWTIQARIQRKNAKKY